MTRMILACLVLSASALSAQQQPLVGTWKLSYPAGMRMVDGAATPIMATGVLTIAAQGDSLVGDLTTDPSPEHPQRPATRLSAPAAGGDELVFASRSEATINRNGDAQTAVVWSTWTFEVKGDSLVGTVERKVEGIDLPSSGPQPVTGVRAKR